MTLPRERLRAISMARDFLIELLYPAQTPGVPRAYRTRARDLLRHYPMATDLIHDMFPLKPIEWGDLSHYSEITYYSDAAEQGIKESHAKRCKEAVKTCTELTTPFMDELNRRIAKHVLSAKKKEEKAKKKKAPVTPTREPGCWL